jgi:hypothetical protein
LSTEIVRIFAGACRSDDDTEDIVIAPGSFVTITITSTGANGRNVDTAEAANKWYAVYVIKDPATGTVAGFLINESDLATLPGQRATRKSGAWVG